MLYTGGTCSTDEERRFVYRVLWGKPQDRWEDNIKMDLPEVGWGAWAGLI
jgi:hypothetical protein